MSVNKIRSDCMNKLISVDIDETLTQSNGKPSPKTISTIKRLIKSQNTLVLNSGRNLTNVETFLKYFTPLIHFDFYVICQNGAVAYWYADRTQVFRHAMDRSVVNDAVSIFIEKKLPFQVHFEKVLALVNPSDNETRYLQHQNIKYSLLDSNVARKIELPVFKLVLYYENETEKAEMTQLVREVMGPNVIISSSSNRFLEINRKNVNKGLAIKQLQEHLDLSTSELISIGDNENDVPMLSVSDKSFCMQNGSKLARNVADMITDDNDHDGFSNAMERLNLI